jgi:hypothetical protein
MGCEDVDWINLACGRVQERALLNMFMHFLAENFLTTWPSSSFLKTVLHELLFFFIFSHSTLLILLQAH